MVLNLNESYYLPGETIYVIAMIQNHSRTDVLFSKILIVQVSFLFLNNKQFIIH